MNAISQRERGKFPFPSESCYRRKSGMYFSTNSSNVRECVFLRNSFLFITLRLCSCLVSSLPSFPFLSICCCLLCRCRPFRAQFSRVFIGSPFPTFSGKIVLLPSFELALLGVWWEAEHLTTAAGDCRLLAGAATRKPHGSSIGKQFSPYILPTSSFSFVFIFSRSISDKYIGAIGTRVQEKNNCSVCARFSSKLPSSASLPAPTSS